MTDANGLAAAERALAAGRPAVALALLRPIRDGAAVPQAQFLAGRAHLRLGEIGAAVAAFAACCAASPQWGDAWANLGLARRRSGDLAGAAAAYDRALALLPGHPELLFNLGNLHLEADRPAQACDCYRQVLARMPDHDRARRNLAHGLDLIGDPAGAEASLRAVLERMPADADAAFALALLLLRRGAWAEGWRHFDARRHLPDLRPRHGALPAWDGAALARGTLLVHAEQGLGDAVMMLRFLPAVAARVPDLLVQVPPVMAPLVTRVAAGARVWVREALAAPIAAQVPMMSLPRLLGLNAPDAVDGRPYLSADPVRVAAWRRRFAAAGPGPYVGVAWAGNPDHPADRRRSCGLATLRPVLEMPGITWVSLQFGPGHDEIAALGLGDRLLDPGADLSGLAATAAAIAALDLVVTIDSMPAHLAGALGVPVSILLPRCGRDWRWGVPGSTMTPWYDCARLIDQPAPGDWDGAVAALREYLTKCLPPAGFVEP